jgi:Zn-finger nucleic acid-binding protein
MTAMGTSEGVTLDFCESCQGMLFDHGEVAEYFELSKDVPDLAQDLKQARKSGNACPKCGGHWVEIPYVPADNLLIDLCTKCGAIWLDKGEFPKLEKLAAGLESPRTKLLRAVCLVEKKGYRVLGWKRA